MSVKHIGFQGEHGAYSEQAIFDHFGQDVEPVTLRTVSDVFRAVENGETEAGVVPVENSIGGNIYETYDMLAETTLNITGEIVLKIEHCLIGLHGAHLSEIRTVYSHPQAIEQCREFLTRLGVKYAYSTFAERSWGIADVCCVRLCLCRHIVSNPHMGGTFSS